MNTKHDENIRTSPAMRTEMFVSPTVELSDPVDGLLQAKDTRSGVPVTFPVWPDANDNDFYCLIWNGTLLERSMLPGNPVPGSTLTLILSAKLLAAAVDGVHQLRYGSQRYVGGTPNESPSIPIIIDRTPPGGEVLAPMIFPAEAQDSLSAAELLSMGNQLVGSVPRYFDIKWGDVIRTYWADQPGPVHTVLAEEVDNPMISVTFDPAFLDNLDDGPLAVTYTVTDRAGNVSVVSQVAQLMLQLQNNPTDLLAPLVPQAADGLIDNADGRQGVLVQVPAFAHAQVGDAITVLWGELRLPEQLLSAEEIGQPVLCSTTVTYASLAEAGDGEIPVRYEVRRAGNLLATSPTLPVQVFLTLPGPQDESPQTLITEALAAPIIRGKSDNPNRQDNVLDADDYSLSADALIAWREQFQACDQINLFWGSATESVIRLINQNDVQAATTLVISLPNSLITSEGACKPVAAHYTVTHAGNPNTSYSPSQSVRLIAPDQLPGGGCGLPAPIFTQVNACNTVEPAGSPDGTYLQVKPYRRMQIGDVVTLSFKGFNAMSEGDPVAGAAFSQSVTLDEDAALKGCRFKVERAALLAIELGRAEARYEVSSANGRVMSQKADAYVDMRTPAAGCQAFSYSKG